MSYYPRGRIIENVSPSDMDGRLGAILSNTDTLGQDRHLAVMSQDRGLRQAVMSKLSEEASQRGWETLWLESVSGQWTVSSFIGTVVKAVLDLAYDSSPKSEWPFSLRTLVDSLEGVGSDSFGSVVSDLSRSFKTVVFLCDAEMISGNALSELSNAIGEVSRAKSSVHFVMCGDHGIETRFDRNYNLRRMIGYCSLDPSEE